MWEGEILVEEETLGLNPKTPNLFHGVERSQPSMKYDIFII